MRLRGFKLITRIKRVGELRPGKKRINLKSWGGIEVKGDICRKKIDFGQKLPRPY